MTYFFVRHGQTNYNVRGLCNDNPDRDVHLTPNGIAQAQAAAETLRAVPLKRIHASPLPRTQETARIINRYHQLPIEIQPALADIRSGFDGRPVQDYQRAIAADRLHMSVNGGESLLEHKHRVIGFLRWLTQQPDQNQLVVAHEETLRVTCAFFRNLSDDVMLDLRIPNGEILKFETSSIQTESK